MPSATQRLVAAAGHPAAIHVVAALILAWAVAGPIVGYGETWWMVINTGTAIVSALMLFAVQSTATARDVALHAKLDEILRGVPDADSRLVGVEADDVDTAAAVERARALHGE